VHAGRLHWRLSLQAPVLPLLELVALLLGLVHWLRLHHRRHLFQRIFSLKMTSSSVPDRAPAGARAVGRRPKR
jgi:hypothetical protein